MNETLRQWLRQQLADLVGGADFEAESLPVEASTRRFYRLYNLPAGSAYRSLIAMDAPPVSENNAQFVALARIFRDAGVAVPEVLAADLEDGWLLTTDLGNGDFAAAYARGETDAALSAAIDCLIRLQRVDDPAIPPYTRERLEMELGLFNTFLVSGLTHSVPDQGLRPDEAECLVASALEQPRCCIHRDFHSRNLLWNPGQGFGVVDFQDALIGPLTYDLACLLYDCYQEFPAATVDRWLDEYRRRSATAAPLPQLRYWLERLALQRNLKAMGIFARLWLDAGKASHLPHILPVLRRSQRLAAAHADLQGLAERLLALETPVSAALDAQL